MQGLVGALLHESGASLFVAPVDAGIRKLVEHTILFWDAPHRNQRGIHTRPSPEIRIAHRTEPGAEHGPPLFCGPGLWRHYESGQFK